MFNIKGNKEMQPGELMDISGRPMVMLGGEYTVLRRKSGGLVVEFTWFREEPAIIIFKDGLSRTRVGAYVIELKDAINYVDSKGNPSKSLFMHACEAAEAIGFARLDKQAVFKVMNLILDNIGDLIRMPPCPEELRVKQQPGSGKNELTLKLDGKTVLEIAV